MYRTRSELGPKLRALDELRAADRILAAAVVTLANAEAADLADEAEVAAGIGSEASTFVFDHAAVAQANGEVMQALACMRRALREIDVAIDPAQAIDARPDAALARYAEHGIAVSGYAAASTLHASVRGWFDALRNSDSELSAQVAALPNWDEQEDLVEERPAVVVEPTLEALAGVTALQRWSPGVGTWVLGSALGLAALFGLSRLACG